MPVRRPIRCAAMMLACCVQQVIAWSDGGHLLVGAVAYRQLSTPTRTNAVEVLSHHPSFKDWSKSVVAAARDGVELEELIFMSAALWADDIKGDRHRDGAENRPSWHYINYPLRPPDFELSEPIGGDLHLAITNCVTAIKRRDERPARKAVALAWLIHLVGDLHQPLHNTTLLISRLPESGDRGGNQFFIRPGETLINLHHFWDNLLGTTSNVRTHRKRAIELVAALPPSAFPELLSAKTPRDWSLEGRQLAISVAYAGLDLELGTRNAPALLPMSYTKTCKGVAERQAALAGYRLARLIEETLAR